ncbi:MAG: redoxin domain-containing protein [Chloroflexi bacterium]|nr:redoxin domain-containing protein [Chloroflexota bacterium]
MFTVKLDKAWFVLAGVMVIAAVACTGDATTPPQGLAQQVGVDVGNVAPDFTLTLADGSTVDQAALLAEGKPVLLYFFATW